MVTAEFRAVKQLTVTRAGGGNGSIASLPAGIDCGVTCSGSFEADMEAQLFATPAADSMFTGWSGGCSGAVDCYVLMDGDKSVTATFELRPTLTVTRSDCVSSWLWLVRWHWWGRGSTHPRCSTSSGR